MPRDKWDFVLAALIPAGKARMFEEAEEKYGLGDLEMTDKGIVLVIPKGTEELVVTIERKEPNGKPSSGSVEDS